MADPLRRAPADGSPEKPVLSAPHVGGAPDREVRIGDRWSELRALIVGPERDRLDRVEQKLDDPSLGVEQVSRVLPEAVARRSTTDTALATALSPVLGDAIRTAVRRDPQPLADAIFPIIGPAIRRSIAATFAELVQSLNTTLEHSFTPRGLAWRFEALRTGRSFGEVVLSHSLLYRVEQLFVIHRESGLLVKHLTAPGVQALPPDMVAGMLSAITDFARDSFRVSRQEGLDSFALGDLSVWLEDGPAVVLAAVIRGQPPASFRAEMQRVVEGVQQAHASELDAFARTGEAFPIRPELLEHCLIAKVGERAAPSRWRVWALGTAILLGVGWCAAPRVVAARRFDRYVEQLRLQPGMVVGNVGRAGGRYELSGLRDPLAPDPQHLMDSLGLDSSRVRARWEPYVSLRPEFVLQRASQALAPPPTVQLRLRGDTLVGTGVAGARWRDQASTLASAIPGISVLDLSAVGDSGIIALRARAAQVESLEVSFSRAETTLDFAARRRVDSLAATLRALERDALAQGLRFGIEVRGSADSVGRAQSNEVLSAARAATLRRALIARGLAPAVVRAIPDSSRSARSARAVVDIRHPSP